MKLILWCSVDEEGRIINTYSTKKSAIEMKPIVEILYKCKVSIIKLEGKYGK